jgi:hypothetical protein
MVWYTLEEYVFLYDTYVKYGPRRKCRRKFRHKFCDDRVPSKQTVHSLVNKLRTMGLLTDNQKHKCWVLTEKLHDIGARLEHTPRKSLECLSLVQGWQHNCWSHPAKVGVWCAVSAWRIVVPVYFLTKHSQKLSMCREDGIFNTSCDLWIVTSLFRMLSAIRHADSLTKFACSLPPAEHRLPWSAEPWTCQVIKNPPCIWRKVHITNYSENFFFNDFHWFYMQLRWSNVPFDFSQFAFYNSCFIKLTLHK